jgi:hypothetical protein
MEGSDMANENELNELRERIGHLPFSDQFRLLGWILADHARRCDEAEAAYKTAVAEALEHDKVLRELDRQKATTGESVLQGKISRRRIQSYSQFTMTHASFCHAKKM